MTPVKAWRAVDPLGNVVVSYAPTRRGAIAAAFNPDFGMQRATLWGLERQHEETAGWASIATDGWRVEPIAALAASEPTEARYAE